MDEFEKKELVVAVPSNRNWLGIFISLIVIAIIIGLITLSVFLVTPHVGGLRVNGSRFHLDHLFNGSFDPPTFRGKWISGTELVFRDDYGGVSLLHTPTLNVNPLVSNFTFRLSNIEEFEISPDKRYILLQHDVTQESPVYNLHPTAKYSILEINYTHTQHSEPVTPFPNEPGHPELQYAAWVPGDSQKIIMIHQNDIYVKESPASPVVMRITSNGKNEEIYNGVTDLLYKDYIFKSSSALWLSSDGSWLCYATFNDTAVAKTTIPMYMQQYAQIRTIRYPMVDSVNPTVSLWVVDLKQSSASPKEIVAPNKIKDKDHYITSVAWASSDKLMVVWRNRAQNLSVSTLCQPVDGMCHELFVEECSQGQWLLSGDAPLLGHNTSSYVVLAPSHDSEDGTYPHIHQGSTESRHHTPLTYGAYSVYKILAWDTINHYIYYIANREDESSESHLWRVSSLQATFARTQECITCDLNYTEDICKDYSALMAPDSFDELVLHCSGPSVPHTVLYSIIETEVTYYIHSNPELQNLSTSMAWPIFKTLEVPLEDGIKAKVRLIMPPEYEDDNGQTYPVVVTAPGPPGEQMINHKWHVNWNTYLASNKSWVVVEIDSRGSGGQELNQTFQPAWRLGQLEAHDYLHVTRNLVSELKFLDSSRVVVWGWGHAGFNAATILATDHQATMCCAAAVAMPTDWTQYASFYSEKYMGSSKVVPGGNFRGYEETSLLNRAGELRNRTFMLLHGTADTNVHYSHSLRLTKALTKYNALFRAQAYTDEGHDLKGVQRHLYSTIENFLISCFPPYTQDEIDLKTGT